jgi:hypothetical protein
MAQVVELLPSMCDLNPNPSTEKKKILKISKSVQFGLEI